MFAQEPILRVSNLCVTFKRHHGIIRSITSNIRAVDNVSFELFESEFVSIVGESGSGKTTLAKCVLGLVPPTSGTITYRGSEVKHLKGDRLRNYLKEVQIIYQDPFESLNPRHNVLTTLSIPIRQLTGERDRERIRTTVLRLLQEVGLAPDIVHRFPHELSGGQRQRVNIARALAPNPKVLIADEPVTMLDAAQRLKILRLLNDLKDKRRLTVLMITHDLASARLASNRTLVMYLGRLVELGSTREILSRPLHPYVEVILEATPRLRQGRDQIGEFSIQWIEESTKVKSGCIFQPRCKYADKLCVQVDPPLEEKIPGHFAACHHPLPDSASVGKRSESVIE